MDNSAYVPNHLPPPSLVVFSQSGGLPEALRMQRPFNPQVTDSKDLQVPFSTAASLGYGLHHMLHLPPQFLHPLDHRLPFGGFRPLGPSAFAPPSKCLKVETGNGPVTSSGLPSIGSLSNISNMFSPSSLCSAGGSAVVSVSGATTSIGGVGGGASTASGQDIAPQSPAGSTSRSPTGPGTGSVTNRGTTPEEEDRDTNATPGSENTERSTPEEGRPYRRLRVVHRSSKSSYKIDLRGLHSLSQRAMLIFVSTDLTRPIVNRHALSLDDSNNEPVYTGNVRHHTLGLSTREYLGNRE
ncbi:hypothetical protein WN55_03146 [Dufourea novaeangliae]|uniref:Uncharacterized protein n=1 Tax=Dufourea novaeangliae TaxID=178035 RepID=A0A154PJR4_DUFNO|nr:hypothetical protein WN55_03146 [Dufourea novaeangliae]